MGEMWFLQGKWHPPPLVPARLPLESTLPVSHSRFSGPLPPDFTASRPAAKLRAQPPCRLCDPSSRP